MNKFNHCQAVEIGDIFTRIDRNGKVWKAEVVSRTEHFVTVKKTQPYKLNAEPTFEKCELYRHYEEIVDGELDSIWGKIPNYKKVPTCKYYIKIKEFYSNYDKKYELIKKEVNRNDA